MEVRLATLDDLEAIQAITAEAYQDYLPLFGGLPSLATEDYKPRVKRQEVSLACSKGQLAGVIVIEQGSEHHLVYSVAVAPSHSGRGIGTHLIRLAEAEAQKQGIKQMRLFTNSLMERNIALYQRLGYTEFERKPHPTRPEFMLIHMAKDL